MSDEFALFEVVEDGSDSDSIFGDNHKKLASRSAVHSNPNIWHSSPPRAAGVALVVAPSMAETFSAAVASAAPNTKKRASTTGAKQIAAVDSFKVESVFNSKVNAKAKSSSKRPADVVDLTTTPAAKKSKPSTSKQQIVSNDIYNGTITNNKRNGKGRMEYADGNVYEGEYCNH